MLGDRTEPLRPHDPRALGEYEIVGRLGEGGMGTVYLGRTPGGVLVAVKVVRADLAPDDEFRRRFRSEVARARQVPPFCTAEVLDADPDHDRPYLVVSLAASTALSALGSVFEGLFAGKILLAVLNTVVSLAIFTLLFTAIYKVLPDTAWRDLVLGAFITAVLFAVGKSLIGIYLGRAAPSSPYGAAGALIVLMFWTYYSAQIFLFGAEITRAYSVRRGSRPDLAPVVAASADKDIARPRPGTSDSEVATWILLSSLVTLVLSQLLRRRS